MAQNCQNDQTALLKRVIYTWNKQSYLCYHSSEKDLSYFFINSSSHFPRATFKSIKTTKLLSFRGKLFCLVHYETLSRWYSTCLKIFISITHSALHGRKHATYTTWYRYRIQLTKVNRINYNLKFGDIEPAQLLNVTDLERRINDLQLLLI